MIMMGRLPDLDLIILKVALQFGRILVPIEEMMVARGEKKKRYKVESRIFPGYVFVEMRYDDELYVGIRGVSGVAKFIISTTYKPVEIFIVAGSIYLLITFLIHSLIKFLEKKYSFNN